MEVPLVQNQMVGGVENLSGEELLNGTGFLLQQKNERMLQVLLLPAKHPLEGPSVQ